MVKGGDNSSQPSPSLPKAFPNAFIDPATVLAVSIVPKVRIWRYPSGDSKFREAVEIAAKQAAENGVSEILFPVVPNEWAHEYGVQVVNPEQSSTVIIRGPTGHIVAISVTEQTAVDLCKYMMDNGMADKALPPHYETSGKDVVEEVPT